MQVIIVAGSDNLSIEISPQEPVLHIKQKLMKILGIPAPLQTLSVLGVELIDGLDMDDYPIIKEGTRIDLFVSSSHDEHMSRNNKFPVIIKFSSRQLTIEVDVTETVKCLKEKIHIIDGTPIKRMLLYASGVELEQEFRFLFEYGITEFSEIMVFLKNMNQLKIEQPCKMLSMLIQTSESLLNSAILPLEMKDSSSVNEVKQLLLSRKILPMDDYIFIHKQRIMRDNCSLRWHGVENGDYLYVFKGTVSMSGC